MNFDIVINECHKKQKNKFVFSLFFHFNNNNEVVCLKW